MNTKANNQEHYYATCALGWKTAPTREEAIEGLVKAFRSDFIRMTKNLQKEGNAGAYIWSCKVHAPADAHYAIEFYVPKGVEISDVEEYATTYVTQKQIAYCRDYKQEARLLREKLEELKNENEAA